MEFAPSEPEHELKSSESARRYPLGEIIPPITYEPLQLPHTSTIIFLHGRGFNAEKFSSTLLSEKATGYDSLRLSLPRTRFVFPVAPLMRATKYRRSVMNQWYDGSGDWEPEARGNMRKSAEHIQALIQAELQLVKGDSRRIVLAGMSQGCSMALTSLLLWNGPSLGACVGMCGFLPITAPLLDILDSNSASAGDSEVDGVVFESETAEADAYIGAALNGDEAPTQEVINALWEETELPGAAPTSNLSFRSTPLFFGHGVQDGEVDYAHACEAVRLLEKLGMTVEFHAYAELGHWYSAEMLGDVVTFLTRHV